MSRDRTGGRCVELEIAPVANAGSALSPEHSIPMWGEVRCIGEGLALLRSPVYRGSDVPHGDKSPVILVPGYMGIDSYLSSMFMWLRRISYTPHISQIGLNAGCIDLKSSQLEETIRQVYKKSGRKVTLIGHSLGGTLAVSAAYKNSGMVRRVVALGAPIRPIDGSLRLSSVTYALARIAGFLGFGKSAYPDCFTPNCNCPAVRMLGGLTQPPIATTLIYTKTDGVVNWRCTVIDDPKIDVEVKGSHVGLAFNPQVYLRIVHILYSDRTREKAVA